MNNATAAKYNRETFAAQATRDREAIVTIERDEKYSDAGRAAAIAPIRERAAARHQDFLARTRTLVDAARLRYEQQRPRSSQARAAIKAPERAAAVKALAQGLSTADLLHLATTAAEMKDLAAAHGIRLAMQGTVMGAIPEADAAAIHSVLDRITEPGAEEAVAEYLAAKIEYDLLEMAGPFNEPSDAVLTNPGAALSATRRAAAIELEDGALRHLSDRDRVRLQVIAGTVDESALTLAAA